MLLLPMQRELLFIVKVDYVGSILVTNKCNSFHIHSIFNFFQHTEVNIITRKAYTHKKFSLQLLQSCVISLLECRKTAILQRYKK